MEAPPALRMLIVDDEEDDRERIRETMSEAPVDVTEMAEYGRDLRKKAQDRDVVCLDLMVNGSDREAVDAAQLLREEQAERAVIVLTNHPPRGPDAQSSAVSFYLQKTDDVLDNMPWYSYAATLHDKGMYVLNQVADHYEERGRGRRPSQARDDGLYGTVRRMHEVLTVASDDQPWADREVMAGWSGLGAALQPLYEARHAGPADLLELHPALLDGVQQIQQTLAAAPGVTVRNGLAEEVDALRSRLEDIETGIRTASDTVPVVRKYTEVDFPGECTVGKETPLRLRVRDEGTGGRMDLAFPTDEVELEVTVSGDGFEIPESWHRMRVKRVGDSDLLEVKVIPRATGDHYLYVRFYRDTENVGTVIVHSTVVHAPAAARATRRAATDRGPR